MSKSKRILGAVLSCLIFLSMAVAAPLNASAAAKPKLNKTKATITRTKSVKLKLKNATASKVKWSSSNKKIATVSKGKVTGKKAGTATVTAKYKGKSYKCKVTVKGKSVKKGSFTVYKNETMTLQLKNSAGTVLKVKSWKSSNKAVATVTAKGVVTGKKVGSATITATDTLGDQYKATVKVQDPYLALKNFLISNGKIDEDGNYYISDSYTIGSTEYTAFITYDSAEKSFEFYSQNPADDLWFCLYMDIAYGGTSKAPTIYMCVDDESLYFGATAEINPATYTDNTDIDFNLVRGSVDNDKLQDWANGDLYVSILMWDDMVYNSIGASMKAFGFTKF